MPTQQNRDAATFQVLDAMDAPDGGRILRVRLTGGNPPPVKSLKGSRLRARSPSGEERWVTVDGFALFGGRPSDKRLARSGRIDLRVEEEGPEGPRVSLQWELTGPL